MEMILPPIQGTTLRPQSPPFNSMGKFDSSIPFGQDCNGSKGSVDPRISQRNIDWSRIERLVRRPRLVFDGRNVVNREVLEQIGFQVYSVGSAGR